MSKLRTLAVFSLWLVLTFVLTFARSAAAADPPTSSDSASAATLQDDDEATLQLAEPDFRLINLPTTLRLPKFKGNFDLTHRFGGNLRRGSFTDQLSNLFGIDEGAVVGLEYRFGVARHLEAVAYRTSLQRTIQLYAKYDAIHQHEGVPLSSSLVLSDEGTDNFQEDFAPAIGVSLSHIVGDVLAVYAVPTWVHNSAALAGIERNTAFIGVGGRLRFRPSVYVVAEVSPRVSGYRPGTAQYGFGIEKRAGGHMFQLNFTNGVGTTLAQIARGGQPDNLALGFNLARKFY